MAIGARYRKKIFLSVAGRNKPITVSVVAEDDVDAKSVFELLIKEVFDPVRKFLR